MSSTESSLVAYGIFATIGLLLYAIFPKKTKWIVLLVLSYLLVFFLSSFWAIFLIVATFIVYLSGILIDNLRIKFDNEKLNLSKDEKKILKKKIKSKQKIIMIIGVILALTMLSLLKYFNLPLGKLNNLFTKYHFLKIAFPLLGISYYVLTAIGYLIDVGRGKYEAQRNFFKLALFIGFFPCQIEGPFQRYDKTKDMLFKQENPTYNDLSVGTLLTIWGLFKKIVIADRLNLVTAEIFNNFNKNSGISIFIGIIFYAFQLYTDFSGYIDIARGTSRLFGIELEKNFDRPFLSKTVGEFWRRWHMSLGSWLKDYVFYSVALSKPYMAFDKKINGKLSPFFEKFIQVAIPTLFVWLACGIWHGAGIKYIVYGMYYYLIMMFGILIEPIHNFILKKLHLSKESMFIKAIMIIRTFTLVLIGLTLFRANSLNDFVLIIQRLFTSGSFNLIKRNILTWQDMLIIIISLCILIIFEIINEFKDTFKLYYKFPIVFRYSLLLVMIFIIIIFGAYGTNYAPVDPLYALF